MVIESFSLYQGLPNSANVSPVRFNVWTSTVVTNEYRLKHLVLRDAYAWSVPTGVGRYLHHSITRKISQRLIYINAYVSCMPYTRERPTFKKEFYKLLRTTPSAFAFEVHLYDPVDPLTTQPPIVWPFLRRQLRLE